MARKFYLAVLILGPSVLLAALRIQGSNGEAYQALAHLWTGALIGAYVADRITGRTNHLAMLAAIVLSVVEVIVAFRL